jgi:ATP-dependent Clp protease adapter protein ClpS
MRRHSKSTHPRFAEVTKLDWSLLDRLVRNGTTRDASTSLKFSLYVLRNLFRLTEDEALDAITDASHDRGIDAVLVDDTNRDVHLFQFKYRESEDHFTKQFPGNSVESASNLDIDLDGSGKCAHSSCEQCSQT